MKTPSTTEVSTFPPSKKKWTQKTPVEFWLDLFVQDRTRWIAVLLFLITTLAANALVVLAALDGRTGSNVGTTVSALEDPWSFSFWTTWRTTIAVILDLILMGAGLFVWRESSKRRAATVASKH